MARKNSTNIRKTISTLVLASVLDAGVAHAADFPLLKEAPVYVPPPVFSWTGFYVGLNAGGGFSTTSAVSNNYWGTNGNYLGTNGGHASGVIGGAQIGYNYQLSPLFVVGVENDFQGTSISTHNGGWLTPDVKLPWFGTGRGRAGLALLDSRLLVYGTGGLALGQVKDAAVGKTQIGWTAGAGVEWAFLPNWSAKLEYLYTDLYQEPKER
jgi:outer membrane immunogenic protein